MSNLRHIIDTIEDGTLDESIQELIKDLKMTQHGDRTNPLYSILSEYHKEGGVWKHTRLAIEVLKEIAEVLDLEDIYEQYQHELRSAALFHDIGKIVTGRPSRSRPGSYAFPGHSQEKIVKEVFKHYDIEPSSFVFDLITQHHASPDDIVVLKDLWDSDKLKALMILKGADNMATGPVSAADAKEHMKSFLAVL